LTGEALKQKKAIINKLVNSGINTSPLVLEALLNLKNPNEDLKIIIKEASFIPSFKGHLTWDILREISNEKVKKQLKKYLQYSVSKDITEDLTEETIQEEFGEEIGDLIQEDSENLSLELAVEESVSPLATHLEDDLDIFSLDQKKEIGKPVKIVSSVSGKSAFAFKPIAKNYDTSFEILRDPTGKLHTNGDYNDFYELTLDKYSKLEELMRKRPEVQTALQINKINQRYENNDVSIMGLVLETRRTKNGNYFLRIEDLTGIMNVLVKDDPRNQDIFKIAESTIRDQMLYIQGTFSPGQNDSKGIIFADYLTKIDIPTNFQAKRSPDPISMALISDMHIGSKEFEEAIFSRFIDFLNGKIGNKTVREIAGKVKYLIINGDLVDGIGVYPNQQSDLNISDIYEQYGKAAEFLSRIPSYIKIFYTAGNHEPVRNAIPRPRVPKKYCEDLVNLGIVCLGNPAYIKTHEVTTLIYHGEGIHDLNMLLPNFNIEKPTDAMREFLKCRHLAPIYGEKTQIAPTSNDWLVIDKIPDIFHTGHIHINGCDYYRNVALINSGCFQAQTDFMRSFGIQPTPGIVPIIELDTLKPHPIDLKNHH